MAFNFNITLALLLITALMLASISPADAQLTPQSVLSETLLQYGSAQTTHQYLLQVQSDETPSSITLRTTTPQILTSHQLIQNQIAPGVFNISVNLFFESQPGNAQFTISAIIDSPTRLQRTLSLPVSHAVYGVVFYDHLAQPGLHIVSGDNASPIQFRSFTTPSSSPRSFRALIHVPSNVNMRPTITVRARTGSAAPALLPSSAVSISDDGTLSLAVAPYRTGDAIVTVEYADLQLHGESFETVVFVSVAQQPAPPVVVIQRGQQTVQVAQNGSGQFELDMFNVDAQILLTMRAVVGDSVFQATARGSQLDGVNQTVRFEGVGEVGVYALEVVVADKAAVFLHNASVALVRAANLNAVAGGDEIAGLGSHVGVIVALGVAGALVAVVVVGGALLMLWSQRRSDSGQLNVEDPYSEAADVGGFGIARDIYGRASFHNEDEL